MMLQDLIQEVSSARLFGQSEIQVKGLAYDSRRVQKGDLFFALSGSQKQGRDFIQEAISHGAVAVVGEESFETEVTRIEVANARMAMAKIAQRFFDFPDRQLQVVGITGTNGKTTTAFLTKHLLQSMGLRCGLIGTVRYEIGDRVEAATHTTPESCELYALLQKMVRENCRAAVMEVSSHALDQYRVGGVDFDVAVFTNLTRDHLDYHSEMESYFSAKQRLFANLGQQQKPGAMVVNGDDKRGQILVKNFLLKSDRKVVFGEIAGDLLWRLCGWHEKGCLAEFVYRNQRRSVALPLFGKFNIANAAAAMGAGLMLGGVFEKLARALESAPSVPGRLEAVPNTQGFKVFVDYAHTDDALRKALETLAQVPHRRLITVFGCGGNRDRTKRPLMGAVAMELSDRVYVTSDNPRFEKPEAIIEEIVVGLKEDNDFEIVVDREEAIRAALNEAGTEDIVLIAGKGHETYQEIEGVRYPFHDREVAQKILEEACE
ncbi:MAG: UDP-N-acetylmuramoyl-L-alanyl-D-glutamate--2,6-diaminopimelate ligase [Verrucomicrobiae bacterium]|nr:UDP-N-acetylmuramoyl-L-alanyl-D-glutamate--2,6-diaminopimelate ligase [Verrucomicrobiae bacterium]